MILFKIIGVFWLSICSMFSYGFKESSYCEEYKELDVQELSLSAKGAFTKTIDGRSDFYLMPITEYFSKIERITYLPYYLGQKYTTYDENNNITSPRVMPDYDANQYGFHFYYHWVMSEGVSSSLFFYDDFDQVIMNPTFNFSNMHQVNRIDLEYYTSSVYPNVSSTYIYTFTSTDNNILMFSAVQYYNPLTNGGNGQYNPDIYDVEIPTLQYATYLNDELNPLAGLSFRNFNSNPFISNYLRATDYDINIYNNGFTAGVAAGNATYYDEGYSAGFAQGQSTVNQSSYDAGYSAGMMDANGTNPYMNSIFSGIFQVGLLPVNVFLTMFNYEIFGINVSGLVSGLLTMSIIVIIFRFLFGGKSND